MIRQRHLTLACSVVGAAVVALDGTVLTLAQPALQRDFDADFGQVQWTSTGYLVAVASLLVFAGRLGDRYGHRRIFALGTLGFAAASAGIALAPGIGWVIALRVLQGVCGALLQPATLGMLRAAYPADRLAMPIALRTSAIGLAAAAGPLVGGALVSAYGWRSVFALTVLPAFAIGILALAVPAPTASAEPLFPAASPTLAERGRLTAAGTRASLDLPGAFLLAVTLACLVHVLVAAPETGATAGTALALATALVAGAVLVRHERRAAHPLLPPALLRSRPVAAGLGALLAASAALFGSLFVATYFLQDVRGLDPLTSAVWTLPLAVLMVLGAPAAALAQRRFGPRRTTVAGALLLSSGVLLLSRLDERATAVTTGGCFVLLGAGFSTVMVTATAVVVKRAAAADAGVAGGLQQTAMNTGPALGVAMATLLMTLDPSAAFVPAMGTTLLALAAVAALGAAAALGLPAGSAAPREAERPPPAPLRR
ncbi:MFS transporter [Streptomyces lateritius]|uniref:MFS transporter n=1 Tax=Streptomyces lateritius TaxID=67313 RepID=UPI001989828C|nr:MFS transporter [Streptomyces lateritius]GGT74605.1 MFS transporter [Streptomyces lateritius]